MPSMVTAPTVDGKPETFREFMTSAAHVMSMFRPLDGAPLPDKFTVDVCIVEMLEQCRAKLAELKALDLKQWETLQRSKYDEHEQLRRAKLAEIAIQRSRVEARLNEVIAWTPPSANHRDFKSVVIRQLEETLRVDCNAAPWEQSLKMAPVEHYKRDALAAAENELHCITKMYDEAVAASTYRTRWVQKLMDSLPADDLTD